MINEGNHQLILVMDFGGQYNQLIARRVRECGVYCQVVQNTMRAEQIAELAPVGIIFTGGPSSVFEQDAPKCDSRIFDMGIPVLGICYGHQLMTHELCGKVVKCKVGEYGKCTLRVKKQGRLLRGLPEQSVCWMSHSNSAETVPDGFEIIADTKDCAVAAMENEARGLYGVQFHPEVMHTEYGNAILSNFLKDICGCTGDWHMSAYADDAIAQIKKTVGGGTALCALSGGVDSSVCAALMHKAIGEQLYCMFVDTGLMRKNEGDQVEDVFKNKFGANFIRIDARDRFLGKLAGVSDPEKKRKIIGEEFIRVFEQEAAKLGDIDFLVQGTIYPDVIESGLGKSAVIKSHHNVGGLPENIKFKQIIEPLRNLFKDEVRALGLELGLPEELVWRQPFPGPGLAVRVIGEITEDKLEILREADAIFREEIKNAGLMRDINQYFAVLTDMKSVGVMGDERTYDYTLALRGVTTGDFMTADWARIPYEVLDKVSVRIVNEVRNINRIVYDITSKPPATIEWE